MKISIQVLGSLGDVLPYVSLALVLKARGIDVAILAPRDFSELIADYGIEVSETVEFSLAGWMKEAAERGTLSGPISFFRDWNRMIQPHIDDVMSHCLEAGRDADLIVSNLICAPARIAAEAHGLPFVLTAQQSVLSPTVEEPCAMMWRPWHGERFNRVGYGFVSMANRVIGRSLGRHRKRLGLGRQPAFSDLRSHLGKPLAKISSVPWPVMRERPRDWGAADYLTAYPSLPVSKAGALSEEVQAFLDDGEAPVYVGLGSLSGGHGDKLLGAAIDGLELAGRRGIIAGGLGTQIRSAPQSMLMVGREPHDVLFPRCAAVIHHGGAGTSDTCLRAGVPQILQPHFLDQFWYANRLEGIGVSPAPLPSRDLSAGQVAEALEIALSEECQVRANAIGCEARAQNGAEDLAQTILETI
ncbi:MAG: glycosyltransferase [Hyphomonadaceae bacterium]